MFCFVCHTRSPKSHASCCALYYIYGKLLTSKGAPTWFEIAWSYYVEVVDYWTIFSMKKNKFWNWKKCWNLGKILDVLGKALDKSDLIEFYFTIFRAKVWVLEWMLLLKIQKKIAKIGFSRKNQLSCQMCCSLCRI